MKIGLVGWGIETKSAYNYFGPKHDYLICNEEVKDDFPTNCDNVVLQYLKTKRSSGMAGTIRDLSYLNEINNCDLVVFSVAARKNLETLFPDRSDFWKKAKTTQHIFFENCPTKNIIGVTGTKGKGTTSTLIHKMLLAAHYPAHLAGNIGISVLELLPKLKESDWVVLELSSFQLYKFPYSPHIGVHLMIMPEHLDWHDSMEEYIEAKRGLFAHQTAEDIAIYLPTNTYSTKNAETSRGIKIPYTEEPGAFIDESGHFCIQNSVLCSTTEARLLGAHNYENICAAITAAWHITRDANAITSVVKTFSGLEHRLEYVADLNGITFYDDSFGTTPDTAIVAMNAFNGPKIMIIGGYDKGSPMESMTARLLRDDIKHTVFIGSTGPRLYELAVTMGLDPKKATVRHDGNSWTMAEIIEACMQHASDGDTVLLSTGSASFGLFKDYKDRGEQFKAAVLHYFEG